MGNSNQGSRLWTEEGILNPREDLEDYLLIHVVRKLDLLTLLAAFATQ